MSDDEENNWNSSFPQTVSTVDMPIETDLDISQDPSETLSYGPQITPGFTSDDGSHPAVTANPTEAVYSAHLPDRPLKQRPNEFKFVKDGPLAHNIPSQLAFITVWCVVLVAMMMAPWLIWYWLRAKDQKMQSKKPASHPDWIRLKSMPSNQTPKRTGLEKIMEADDEYRDAV